MLAARAFIICVWQDTVQPIIQIYADLANVHTFYYRKPTSHILLPPIPQSHQKSLSAGQLSGSHWWIQVFQTLIFAFPQEGTTVPRYTQKRLCVFFPLKGCILKSCYFVKRITFTVLWRTFGRETGLCSLVVTWWHRVQCLLVHLGALAWLCARCQPCTCYYSCTINTVEWKRQMLLWRLTNPPTPTPRSLGPVIRLLYMVEGLCSFE